MRPRVAYVNGRFLPYAEAAVPIEDRGLQFADSIYEVWAVSAGELLDCEAHLERLERNLAELRIRAPLAPSALGVVLREAVRRNRVREGLVYLQVTRGAGPRNPLFPPEETRPTLIVTARPVDRAAAEAKAAAGVAVALAPDQRWARCDLKTTGLLPNLLAKETARALGAAEAWLVDAEGRITEGASSSAWLVESDTRLRTRPLGPEILPGVTRATVARVARNAGLEVLERAFTPEEAFAAREAFSTSASGFVTPVVRLGGRQLGDGRPGPVTLSLRHLYLNEVRNARRGRVFPHESPGS